jgi:hypothetical protein
MGFAIAAPTRLKKARGRFPGAGSKFCDDETMQVICPTGQELF